MRVVVANKGVDGYFNPAAFSVPGTTPSVTGAETGYLNITDNGGGTSQSVFLQGTGLIPAPAIISISPPSAIVAGPGFTLTVTGNYFIGTSVVRWNGTNRMTTFVSSTTLTASILASDIGAVGTAQVTIFTPAPGGGTSAPSAFNIVGNPVPIVSVLSPGSAFVGGNGFTLNVSCGNFISSSVVQWNGSNRQTSFVSNTMLQAVILPGDIATLGAANVQVFTPAPGGGTSNAQVFTITANPVPVIFLIEPPALAPGGNGFPLTVFAGNIVTSSVVQWNGSNRATTFAPPNQLVATILASDVATAGTAQVTVFNSAPGGGASAPVSFTISLNPAPSMSALSQTTVFVGGNGFSLNVFGTSFVPSSLVQWNGSSRPTTFVSVSLLTASIPSSDIAVPGTFPITVFTPAPGGGTSASLAFQVIVPNPVPSISSISPASATGGGPDFTLTVNGANFVPVSKIQWIDSGLHSVPLQTTFLSANQLQVPIPSSLETIGTSSVSVFNPPPAGGYSAALPFTISPPPGITVLNLTANHLVWEPYSRLIYASVPSAAGANGNTITVIDPYAGTVGASTPVGSEPDRVAVSDDGQFLYSGLDGSNSVERLRLPSLTPDLNIPLGSDPRAGPFIALYLEALPGVPHSFAVTRGTPGSSPEAFGVAVFDDAVQRPHVSSVGSYPVMDSLQFGSSASTLYAFDNEDTNFTLYRLAVDSTGLTIAQQVNNLTQVFTREIHYDGGLIYFDSGQVVDSQSFTLVGSFPYVSDQMVPDSTLGRAFFVPDSFGYPPPVITAFDQFQFTALGTLTIPITSPPCSGGFVASFIRWGASGLAFRVASLCGAPGQVILVNSPFVLPVSATNNPLPTASTLSPVSAVTGSGNFQLTVNGSNFVLGASVQWNGKDRTTKFVSSTQLIAYIPASDIAAAGTPQVTVVNPAPAGGASTALTFTVAP